MDLPRRSLEHRVEPNAAMDAPDETGHRHHPLTGLLAVAVRRLELTDESLRERGIVAGDLEELAEYLREVAAHGHSLAARMVQVIGEARDESPLRSAGDGLDADTYLDHANRLFDAAQTMASEAMQRLDRMDLSNA